jgi:hypothetical protein
MVDLGKKVETFLGRGRETRAQRVLGRGRETRAQREFGASG